MQSLASSHHAAQYGFRLLRTTRAADYGFLKSGGVSVEADIDAALNLLVDVLLFTDT